MAEAFPISGQIDPKAFPFLLMDLHRHGATGSLKVDGPSYQKALYFRSGRILFGSSNDPRDQLGAILIESGKIAPEQLEEVNTKVGPGNPLAKVLSESGFVNQRELSDAARAKVERILSDVIAYAAGSFEFEDGVLPKGAVDLKLSTERLVLSAVRRVTDRAFVLRQLDGLDVVLSPVVGEAARLTEIQAETGGLADQIDGQRTLKEAAALTRLDEFEAAKVACALLFLGTIERAASGASGAPLALDEAAAFDLAHTARMAFAPSESESPIALPPPVETGAELPFFVDSSAAATLPGGPLAGEIPAFLPPPPPPPPQPKAAAPAPEPEPAPTVLLTQKAAAPAPSPAPSPVVRPAPAPSPAPLPLVRPSPAPRRAPEPEPEPEAPRAAPSKPSKEDLAALDALLNSRTSEGPMEPLEKSPTQPRWEPRFGHGSGGSSRRPAAGQGRALALSAVGVLAVTGGVGYWLVAGGGLGAKPTVRRDPKPSPPPVSVAAAAPSPAPPTTVDAPGPSPGRTPPPPVTEHAAGPSPSAIPSPPPKGPAPSLPSPASPAPPRTGASPGKDGGLEMARGLLQKGSLAEAARGFASNLKDSPRAYSIQLLVACSDETVQKAVQNVQAPELFIVPVNYKGRSCYRICWGLYESEPRAGSALSSVPEYFHKGGATARVMPASGLLP